MREFTRRMNRGALWINHRKTLREAVRRRWIDDARVRNHHSRWNTFEDGSRSLSSCSTAHLSYFSNEEMAVMIQSVPEIRDFVLSHVNQVAHISFVEQTDNVSRLRIVEDQSNSRVSNTDPLDAQKSD